MKFEFIIHESETRSSECSLQPNPVCQIKKFLRTDFTFFCLDLWVLKRWRTNKYLVYLLCEFYFSSYELLVKKINKCGKFEWPMAIKLKEGVIKNYITNDMKPYI